MNSTSQGFLFETLALAYLERQGLLFVARNVSGRYGEIDLIMKDQTQLVFVEVKYRKSSNYGGPLAAITASKQQKLRLTATAYLQQHAPKAYARFDVIAISGDEPFHFEWLKNAFNQEFCMQEHIRQLFTENIQTMIATGEALSGPIESAALTIVQALISDRKVLCCGEGAARSLAGHFAQLLLDQFETERPCLPALALTVESASLHHRMLANQDFLARQVRALGQEGDILLVLSLSGDEASLIQAVEAALTKDMTVIALTVDNNGELSGLLGNTDTELRVPAHRPARVYECYAFLLHCVVELIDNTLFPQQDEA